MLGADAGVASESECEVRTSSPSWRLLVPILTSPHLTLAHLEPKER